MTATLKAPPPPPKARPVTDAEISAPAPVVPARTLPALSPSARVIYGGRPAYVGADCWFITTTLDGYEVIALPARLFRRGYVQPDLWTLSVQGDPGAMPTEYTAEFSETPTLQHWCWPVVPSA